MTDNLCILGSTGSIGCSTLDVVRLNPERFKIKVLSANQNVDKLVAQCVEFKPDLAVIADSSKAEELKQKLFKASPEVEVRSGPGALVESATESGVDTVVAAIVGAAGLLPTLAAIKAGLKVLLANKEALVMSGPIMMQAVKDAGATLLPVDSEHNAIFQSLPMPTKLSRPSLNGVAKILLTGSGGPFREMPLEQLADVTPEQACAHPNWDMGKKISVDSATMMNKGLELIEACFLFDVPPEKIDIVVHPQSIIHSMVSYLDGSVIAQMGRPDMRTPIAHSLAWPNRIEAGVEPLDFYQMANLAFSPPDYQRFPCLRLAQQAMEDGGSSPCVLNAANEVAVEAFLAKKIRFTQISQVIEHTLSALPSQQVKNIDQVIEIDLAARRIAEGYISQAGGV